MRMNKASTECLRRYDYHDQVPGFLQRETYETSPGKTGVTAVFHHSLQRPIDVQRLGPHDIFDSYDTTFGHPQIAFQEFLDFLSTASSIFLLVQQN